MNKGFYVVISGRNEAWPYTKLKAVRGPFDDDKSALDALAEVDEEDARVRYYDGEKWKLI